MNILVWDGMSKLRQLCFFAGLVGGAAALVLGSLFLNGAPVTAQTSDLVDRSQLRVCADPANLPFSDKAQQGFENKIAALVARELDVPLTFTWFPQSIGFIRQTLNKKKCDLIIGYVATHELVLNSNPYYRSAYVLVHRKGEFEGLENLNDPRLKGKRIGVVAGTPPVTILAMNDLLDQIKSYQRMVDRRYYSPAEAMIAEINSGQLDAGLLWGPIGGYFAKKANEAGGAIDVVPLLNETKGPRLVYRITFGVRQRDKVWKRQLNRIIRRNREEIHQILRAYGVPLVDGDGAVLAQPGP